MFSFLPKTNLNFSVRFILSSVNAVNLDQSKILPFGKELMHFRESSGTNEFRKCSLSDLSLFGYFRQQWLSMNERNVAKIGQTLKNQTKSYDRSFMSVGKIIERWS